MLKWKVACVQINPRIGHVDANVSRVRQLVSHIAAADLVVLPELAITGYNFSSRAHVHPYTEEYDGAGPTHRLAREISARFGCFTLAGYPERAGETIYNSAVLVGPDGKSIRNYRKTHLYETDEVWGCSENPDKSFAPFPLVVDREYYLKERKLNKSYATVTTTIGICMDLNPYKFEAPFNAFEMSMAAFSGGAKLLLCPMAWLLPRSPSIDDKITSQMQKDRGREIQDRFFTPSPTEVNLVDLAGQQRKTEDVDSTEAYFAQAEHSTINYWMVRFFPYLKHPFNELNQAWVRRATLVACNRLGVEDSVVYGGSSTIMQFVPRGGATVSDALDTTNPSVEVHGSLGQSCEGVLVREVDIQLD